jgi:hypothetical protein
MLKISEIESCFLLDVLKGRVHFEGFRNRLACSIQPVALKTAQIPATGQNMCQK